MPHLSLAHVATFPTDNAVDSSSMVQALDKSTPSSAHKGVLQSTKKNSVELLDIVLIGSLNRKKDGNRLCMYISGQLLCDFMCHKQMLRAYDCTGSEPVPAETIHSHAIFSSGEQTCNWFISHPPSLS